MTTKERYKALATMAIMRQVVIADTVYYLVSEAKEMQPELKSLEKLKERSLGFVTRMGTFLRGHEHMVTQAAITSFIEESTAVQMRNAIECGYDMFARHGVEKAEAAAYIFLAHALMSGANAAVDAVMDEVKLAQGLTPIMIAIRNYELERSLKTMRDHLMRGVGEPSADEINELYKASSEYATLILSEKLITEAVQNATCRAI